MPKKYCVSLGDGAMVDDRRWLQEIARLRARASKVRRRPGNAAEQDEVLDAALDTCEALLRDLAGAHVDNETLTRRCHAEAATYAHLFEHLPMAAIETDASGLILTANRAASQLLHTSEKYLTNRLLLHFVEDRAAFMALLSNLPTEPTGEGHQLKLRPRERAPLSITAKIIPIEPQEPSTWGWFLSLGAAKEEAAPRRDLHEAGMEP
jgi:PAS domain-containing protein